MFAVTKKQTALVYTHFAGLDRKRSKSLVLIEELCKTGKYKVLGLSTA